MFSRADGFATIGRHEEIVDGGNDGRRAAARPRAAAADLVVIGSHCIGLDYLLGELQQPRRALEISRRRQLAGLEAAKRGECDMAGIHLLDPATGEYNRPFLTPALELIPGYGRLQGIVFRQGTIDSKGAPPPRRSPRAIDDPDVRDGQPQPGSGTRALIDRLLAGARPPGYAVQPRNHNAVAAAVVQGRADWGVTLDTVARGAGLGFVPVQHEQYDFVGAHSAGSGGRA